jgi:hypothetical protein
LGPLPAAHDEPLPEAVGLALLVALRDDFAESEPQAKPGEAC